MGISLAELFLGTKEERKRSKQKMAEIKWAIKGGKKPSHLRKKKK